MIISLLEVDRNNSVGIATRYVLDGPRIDSRRGGARFSAPAQTDPGAHPASCTCVPGLFLEGKTAGAWCWPPTPSIVEVKERVELYLYSLSGPSWPVLGWTLPLLLPFRYQTLVIVEPDTADHILCCVCVIVIWIHFWLLLVTCFFP